MSAEQHRNHHAFSCSDASMHDDCDQQHQRAPGRSGWRAGRGSRSTGGTATRPVRHLLGGAQVRRQMRLGGVRPVTSRSDQRIWGSAPAYMCDGPAIPPRVTWQHAEVQPHVSPSHSPRCSCAGSTVAAQHPPAAGCRPAVGRQGSPAPPRCGCWCSATRRPPVSAPPRSTKPCRAMLAAEFLSRFGAAPAGGAWTQRRHRPQTSSPTPGGCDRAAVRRRVPHRRGRTMHSGCAAVRRSAATSAILSTRCAPESGCRWCWCP